ncbi:DUF350 domain-containing protein [Aeromonas schubertii]|uniref:DUF350 domain-containing protein n=2 Tax=Aeromonas schubertii TaxID=652 RepID=A0ABS7VBN6_9GAMM|nr:DUF350 domain-containing protein [Aeromonas schubertii]MBZ6066525.1 DUF350 domain-containing protein [Aeromonas schubertii]QCG49620.1 DUF350 domain-containing protein [Aeromonas schubertii]
MPPSLLGSLSGLLPFLVYFLLAMVLLGCFVRLYTWLTPHHEFVLIRGGNMAAALAFSGALLGFALPLSSAISHSLSLLDCAIWGAIALMVQVAAFMVMRLWLKDLCERIARGEMASAILLAAISLAVGLLNAACMTY